MDFRIYSLNRIDYLEKNVQGMHGDVFLNIGNNRPIDLKKKFRRSGDPSEYDDRV